MRWDEIKPFKIITTVSSTHICSERIMLEFRPQMRTFDWAPINLLLVSIFNYWRNLNNPMNMNDFTILVEVTCRKSPAMIIIFPPNGSSFWQTSLSVKSMISTAFPVENASFLRYVCKVSVCDVCVCVWCLMLTKRHRCLIPNDDIALT